MTMEKIVGYLYNTIGIKAYILATDRDTADPTDYIELGIQVEDKNIMDKDHFILDNRLDL